MVFKSDQRKGMAMRYNRVDPTIWVPIGLGYFPRVGEDQPVHRRVLKLSLITRDKVCRGCSAPLTREAHMHEGIISRQDVRGWPKAWRVLIFSPYNAILLCRDCNLGLSGKNPPARAQVLAEQVHIYGLGVVRWLRSLPFKEGSNPVKGLLAQYPEP